MSKVILITGTSSGFGRTIAEKLHSEGYTVIGTSRNAEKINSNYLTVKLDINNYDASKSEVDKIIKKHGKIDFDGNFSEFYASNNEQNDYLN